MMMNLSRKYPKRYLGNALKNILEVLRKMTEKVPG